MKIPRRHFDFAPHKKTQSTLEDWTFVVMPKIGSAIHQKKKISKWAMVPFAASVLVISLLLQSAIYVSKAKNAQGEILGEATSAYSDLSAAGASLAGQNFSDAQTKFSDALTNLQSAQNRLNDFRALQLAVPQAKSAEHILAGAGSLAHAGQKLTEALSIFGTLKVSSQGVETNNLKDTLAQNRSLLVESLEYLNSASEDFDAANNLPADYVDTVQGARDQVNLLRGMLQKLVDLEDIYAGFFGSGPKVYLLIFQNPDEMRATGGFIGTYGVLKINDGKIADLKINSIYDLDGHIYANIAAPGPFQPFIKKWGIRDANWFADFPTSARKLLQFFESGQQTADGVISFTPTLFENLLNLTGPISMAKYGVTLTPENFQEIVQYKTSVDYDKKKNEPKGMLADFAPVLLDRLSGLDQEKWLQLLQILQNNLNQKNVLMYSKEEKLQSKIEELRVAGNILSSDQDYLSIINTNLGGTKVDLSISQKANLTSKILSDGSIIDTLTIERYNASSVNNLDYMRVLVPEGSTIVSSQGFDEHSFEKSQAIGFTTDPDLAKWDEGSKIGNTFVRTEAGKTEFAGWLALDSDQTRTVTLSYIIPYKAKTNFLHTSAVYSLVFQKQAGAKAPQFTASLDIGSLKPNWLSANAASGTGKINFSYTSGADQYWAAVLTK